MLTRLALATAIVFALSAQAHSCGGKQAKNDVKTEVSGGQSEDYSQGAAENSYAMTPVSAGTKGAGGDGIPAKDAATPVAPTNVSAPPAK
ncbi:MAG: hypothetical protein HY894_01135 [Deltaproteobacteria bacterium]|nr:hypothetical protein [Deltaproteobacteria bacterium]